MVLVLHAKLPSKATTPTCNISLLHTPFSLTFPPFHSHALSNAYVATRIIRYNSLLSIYLGRNLKKREIDIQTMGLMQMEARLRTSPLPETSCAYLLQELQVNQFETSFIYCDVFVINKELKGLLDE